MRTAVRPLSACSLLVLALAAGGCRFGEAAFEGDLAGRRFDPGGTVFGYLDERDDALSFNNPTALAVAMTWIIFDPQADLNDMGGDELEELRHEMRLRDALSLVFADIEAVATGEEFDSVVQGGSETGNGLLRARLHLAPERLTATSSYSGFTPFGALRRVHVAITEARLLEDGPVVAGDIDVTIERTETDPDDALVGRLEGRFRAPLVEERTAEQNLSLLVTDDILGLPIAGDDA